MNETLFDIDFTETLPFSLKNDKNVFALLKVISKQLNKNAQLSKKCLIYGRIDMLAEDVLDVLAVDLHIDWYDDDAPLEIKREVIKESVKIHKWMGTPWAVNTLLSTYFGDVLMQEWFEYGGEPFHFRLLTSNPDVAGAQKNRFLWILEAVKRKSALLDGIVINISGDATAKIAATYTEHSHETYYLC